MKLKYFFAKLKYPFIKIKLFIPINTFLMYGL